jgi:hypothetical protein
MLEDNIEMTVREIGCSSMEWIDLAQDRKQWQAIMKMIMYLLVSN